MTFSGCCNTIRGFFDCPLLFVLELLLVVFPNALELCELLFKETLLGGSALKKANIITSNMTGSSFTASRPWNNKMRINHVDAMPIFLNISLNIDILHVTRNLTWTWDIIWRSSVYRSCANIKCKASTSPKYSPYGKGYAIGAVCRSKNNSFGRFVEFRNIDWYLILF